ncbi:efflux RND transporter periplasmic adaptor subunit [Flavobacterium chungangense]|uniref:Efflux transporter periplasmic adaptor subunit n=1 Tax=Flavobacterium chungangense TaxID=554283 RepID=A0A6V6YRR3_9FLAO|nr:efflux RND transporter periplasmic adaptor subunit [Flavobacterium chungangense]CAD0002133.1 efflux transporter periplasmic adaptor subunit [Flavobacterium chungangense]
MKSKIISTVRQNGTGYQNLKNNFTLMSKKTIVLCLIAFPLLYACKEDKKEHTSFETADIIPIKTATVQSLALTNNISASGLVTTENQANYGFKIGGIVSRIYVEEGQFFKKGQLLAALDATEINAGLNQTDLNVKKYERDYNRANNLYKDSVYTLEQLQNTKTGLDIAKKQKDAVAFNARYAKIYATANGFVASKIANEGEVVGPGTPILAINETNQNNNYLLKVGLTDKEWASVKIGQKAVVTLDGYPEAYFDAAVFRKSQSADAALGSFQVELKLNMKNSKPAVGMFGKAEIKTENTEDFIVIPYNSLIEADGNKAFVFIVVNNKVKRQPVTITKFENNKVFIKDGLQKTDQIVISNSAYLNEQSKIKIIK